MSVDGYLGVIAVSAYFYTRGVLPPRLMEAVLLPATYLRERCALVDDLMEVYMTVLYRLLGV